MKHRCTKCGVAQEAEAFYWRKDRDCLRQPCKACIAAYGKSYIENDPARKRTIAQRSYQKHRDRTRVVRRGAWLLKNFGITSDDYDALLAAQGGLCAICRQPETVVDPHYGQVRSLAVDHCHQTGLNRGLLCARCNMAIGMLGDDPVVLRAAGDYLVQFARRALEEESAHAGSTAEEDAAT